MNAPNALILSLAMALTANADPVAKAPAGPKPLGLVILADNSSSTAQGPRPATQQAAIVHLAQVASRSGRPVYISAVVCDSAQEKVKVIGDAKGKPTPDLDQFVAAVLKGWGPAQGVSPLDLAIQEAAAQVKAMPAGAEVVVVHIGDGIPRAPRLRPDLYPEVEEMMNDRIGAIDPNLPEDFRRKAVEALERRWADPRNAEAKGVWEKQDAAQLERCLDLAGAFGRRVRFVTLALQDTRQIREIHEAAGGVDGDIRPVDPDQIIDELFDLGLTAFDGVLRDKADWPADGGDKFEATRKFAVDALGESAVITMEFAAIPGFDKHCKITARLGNVQVEVTRDDPNACLIRDAVGHVVGATLVVDAVPDDGAVEITFESPDEKQAVPEIRLYFHVQIDRTVRAAFRPVDAPDDQAAPVRVSPQFSRAWIFNLVRGDEGEVLPLDEVKATFIHKTGHRVEARLEEDEDAPGTFRSAGPVDLAEGEYDVDLAIISVEGLPFNQRLNGHVVCGRADLRIGLIYDEVNEVKITDKVQLPEVGDTRPEVTAKVGLNLLGADGPLIVKVEVVRVEVNGVESDRTGEAKGQTGAGPVITVSRAEVTLQPGRPTGVSLKVGLPKNGSAVVPDGTYRIHLKVTAKNTGEALALEVDRFNHLVEQKDALEFVLKRPKLLASVVAGGRTRADTRRAGPSGATLDYSVAIWLPYTGEVRVRVGHDSQEARTVRAPSLIKLSGTRGEHPGLQMALRSPDQAEVELASGAVAEFVYDLTVPAESPSVSSGTLIFRAEGLADGVLTVRPRLRNPLLAPAIQTAGVVVGGLFLLAALAALVRVCRERAYQPGRRHLLAEDEEGFGGLSLQNRGPKRPPCLAVDPNQSTAIRRRGQGDWTQVSRDLIPLGAGLDGGHAGLLVARLDDEGEPEWVVEVGEVVPTPDGRLEADAVVEEAPPHEAAVRRLKARCLSLAGASVALLVFASLVFSPGMVARLQHAYDAAAAWLPL